MSKQNKPESLQELKAIWYKKLKESGFEDIEVSEDYLKRYSEQKFAQGQNNGKQVVDLILNFESKQEYYRLAGQFLWEHKFETPLAKLIWGLHAEGITYRKIPSLLKARGITKSEGQVQRLLYKLEAAMLIHNTEAV
jgi:hypothetical protein